MNDYSLTTSQMIPKEIYESSEGVVEFVCKEMGMRIAKRIFEEISEGERICTLSPVVTLQNESMCSVEMRQNITFTKIVRCRNCKHSTFANNVHGALWCSCFNEWKSPDGFCDEGISKEANHGEV